MRKLKLRGQQAGIWQTEHKCRSFFWPEKDTIYNKNTRSYVSKWSLLLSNRPLRDHKIFFLRNSFVSLKHSLLNVLIAVKALSLKNRGDFQPSFEAKAGWAWWGEGTVWAIERLSFGPATLSLWRRGLASSHCTCLFCLLTSTWEWDPNLAILAWLPHPPVHHVWSRSGHRGKANQRPSVSFSTPILNKRVSLPFGLCISFFWLL